ncbi:cupin domain-containing protein [Legionella septentrionalis]|uniref:cupin domain-containing protein n=1 Tax=Legionella septentrionalis TaxID=2498109 RepID=UPI000F8CFD24|nr:cupin domain-containing protein [Legionella septentrionalis]RUR08659.1 cupin domain-containing protein [Legionella septentrionalis]RUR13047.1 cupin domain-containing protein [Legionella septentrionalis]
MDALKPVQPKEVIHELIPANHYFPGNSRLPLIIYKEVIKSSSPQSIQALLTENHWINSWVDTIYDYHHYHSNTHEALVIFSGACTVQIGGNKGKIFNIAAGDVIIFPAGISHKNMDSTADFKCVGAYPIDVEYDVLYGKAEELSQAEENIQKLGLPKCDPVYGKDGPLFNYWK